MTNWPLIHALEARLRFARGKYDYRHHKLLEYETKARISRQMGHHQALAEAEAGERKWGQLEGAEAKVVHRLAARIHQLRPVSPVPPGEGTCVPKTAWNPYRRTLANWIAREIYDAVNNHGAQGVVNSGLRTYAEQARLYWIYQHGGNIAAPPGSSNHEGYVYARGAVDWSDPESLNRALGHKASPKLKWAETHGLADWPHFSGTGH